MKLYTDDRLVPYKTSVISPESSKAEIDGLLAKFGVKDVAWRWNPEQNDVYVTFQFSEVVDGIELHPIIKIEPPRIWNKRTRNKPEEINWRVSMRVMFWFIKTHLEMSHLLSSDKTTQFLPYIQSDSGKSLRDVIIPRLERIQELEALPEPEKTPDPRKVFVGEKRVIDQ